VETYEIITPSMVGVQEANTLFLGKHSGRHAFKEKVQEFGIELSEKELQRAFGQFKALTDHKKEVTDDDIYTILMEIKADSEAIDKYELENFQVYYGTSNTPTAVVRLHTPDNQVLEAALTGNGSVEALYKTIDSLIEEELILIDYQLSSVGGGKDALAEAYIQLKVNGEPVNGRGSHQDVLMASANAFLNAVNRYLVKYGTAKKKEAVAQS
jgi:2-isopropylmalate synthase